jgi:hypothetical protein
MTLTTKGNHQRRGTKGKKPEPVYDLLKANGKYTILNNKLNYTILAVVCRANINFFILTSKENLKITHH